MHDAWDKALNRGIEIRWITKKQENINSFTEDTKTLLKNPRFKLRTNPNSFSPEIKFEIYDDKKALIATSNAPNAAESPALWTNNPVIKKILKEHFETKWKNTSQYQTIEK